MSRDDGDQEGACPILFFLNLFPSRLGGTPSRLGEPGSKRDAAVQSSAFPTAVEVSNGIWLGDGRVFLLLLLDCLLKIALTTNCSVSPRLVCASRLRSRPMHPQRLIEILASGSIDPLEAAGGAWSLWAWLICCLGLIDLHTNQSIRSPLRLMHSIVFIQSHSTPRHHNAHRSSSAPHAQPTSVLLIARTGGAVVATTARVRHCIRW